MQRNFFLYPFASLHLCVQVQRLNIYANGTGVAPGIVSMPGAANIQSFQRSNV